MTVDVTTLDAHEQPSDQMRAIWKGFAKTNQDILLKEGNIDDLSIPEIAAEFQKAGTIPVEKIREAFSCLENDNQSLSPVEDDAVIYYHPIIPGLLVISNLMTPAIQKTLLNRLIHRDLSQPHHQTNMHLHFNLPYPDRDATTNQPRSFFTHAPDAEAKFLPKDPSVHKPLTMRQVMDRKLHWVTLGGQYDWTNRVYPDEKPPGFPEDISGFLEGLFPETQAQAAIVNFYTPGDTMMMHRDVSEETDKGLVSLSIGCDALFMIAPNDPGKATEAAADNEKKYLVLRLRSGDAIYMTQEARFAWHGVPKVLKGTCPQYLEDWPAEDDGRYEAWRGWMKNKRINLNVRQIKD